MADVHVPKLHEHDDHDTGPAASAAAGAAMSSRGHRHSLWTIALEVVLIATGVFLGLAGEAWRERQHHREVADASLHRFRAEVESNRKAVAGVKDYHIQLKATLDRYIDASPEARKDIPIVIEGLQPAFFEQTAWDLALATQSLADIEPDLAYSLSRIYAVQREYNTLTNGMVQAMYLVDANGPQFLSATHTYFGDLTLLEPRLVEMYDEVLPRIRRTLGESPVAAHQ